MKSKTFVFFQFEEQKKQNEKLAGENEILKRRLETLEKVVSANWIE